MNDLPFFREPILERLKAVRPEERRRRVVLVASPNPDPLELIGPLNVFRVANYHLVEAGRAELGYDLEVVSSGGQVIFDHDGLKIIVERPYHRLRGEVDTLLFSPMNFEDVFEGRERFLAWVSRMSKRTRRIGTICYATYILAEAGVLEGRQATTHWGIQHDFSERYPGTQLEHEPIYVKDGHIYTSAGATSGVDMTLALIEEDFGRELALRTAQSLVLFLKRPGGAAQFSVQLAAQLPADSDIADLQSYIYEHVDEDLRVEVLAERVGMSPRNFARVFTREVGMSPGRFVERCRIELARQWLQDSDAPLDEVASRCGYATPDGMRLAFERQLGISPRAYRLRFSSAEAS